MQYVYLIQSGNFHKIGIANNPKDRLAQLQTGNPVSLRLLECYGFEDASPVERALHQKYSKFRVSGEWFEDVENIYSDFGEICELLGGRALKIEARESEPEEVEEAEEFQEVLDNSKWDFWRMFSDGWRIESSNENGKKRNWIWRRGSYAGRESIYGGTLDSLPYSIENMRRVYRDGLEPLSEGGVKSQKETDK